VAEIADDAGRVFRITAEDANTLPGEARWQLSTHTGYIGRRLHVLMYSLFDDELRIISLRRTEKYEERRYAKAQG